MPHRIEQPEEPRRRPSKKKRTKCAVQIIASVGYLTEAIAHVIRAIGRL